MQFNIGSAPCSFGINENINWKENNTLSFEEFLHISHDQGYTCYELGDNGFYPNNPLQIIELSSKYNMRCNGIFVSFPLLANNTELMQKQLSGYKYLHKVCKLLNALINQSYTPYIIFTDSIYDNDRIENTGNKYNKSYTCEELYLVLKELINVDTIVKSYGLRLLYHQHAGTFFETFDELLEILLKTEINIVFDTGHFIYGLLRKYKCINTINNIMCNFIEKFNERIELIHLKNVDLNIYKKYSEKVYDNKYNRILNDGIFTQLHNFFGGLYINDIMKLIIKYGYDCIIEQDIINNIMLKKAIDISLHNYKYVYNNYKYTYDKYGYNKAQIYSKL